MKALLINGSPHRRGCTYAALGAVEAGLQEQGIDADIMWIGTGAISGCLGCGKCLKSGRCFIDDAVNQFLDDASRYDAFVFGSPVHFASASGALTSFMDRAFYGRGDLFAGKPAAAIASCRRGAQRQPSTSSISISPFRTWWLLALSIGIKFMETRPRRSCTTKRACRPCVRSAAIWRGL